MSRVSENSYMLADETPEEAANAILGGIEYLVREAHNAGLQDLARALTEVIMTPANWPDTRKMKN